MLTSLSTPLTTGEILSRRLADAFVQVSRELGELNWPPSLFPAEDNPLELAICAHLRTILATCIGEALATISTLLNTPEIEKAQMLFQQQGGYAAGLNEETASYRSWLIGEQKKNFQPGDIMQQLLSVLRAEWDRLETSPPELQLLPDDEAVRHKTLAWLSFIG